MAPSPKVSVIIPCYNDKGSISETIQSVLDQTYGSIEIIVVDDGSTDGSAEFIESRFPGVIVECKANGGPASARNLGARRAAGDLLQFMDADDLIEKDKIESQVRTSLDHPEDVIYGPIRTFRSSGGMNIFDPPLKILGENDDVLDRWLRGWWTIPAALLWPKSVYQRLGGFDEGLLLEEDTDIVLRAVLMGCRLIPCPDAFSYYRSAVNRPGQARNSQSEMNPRTFKSRIASLEKLERLIAEKGEYPKYRDAIAVRYYALARTHIRFQPELSMHCFQRFKELSPTGRVPGTLLNHIAVTILGLEWKERLADVFQNLQRRT